MENTSEKCVKMWKTHFFYNFMEVKEGGSRKAQKPCCVSVAQTLAARWPHDAASGTASPSRIQNPHRILTKSLRNPICL